MLCNDLKSIQRTYVTNCMASFITRKDFILRQKETYSLFKKICMLRWIIKTVKGAALEVYFKANLIGPCILNI